MSSQNEPTWLLSDRKLTRRRLIEIGGVGLTALGAAGLLEACGGSPKSASTGGTTPVRGGTLRFGCQGGANTDTLDAHQYVTNTDAARLSQLYDPLIRTTDQGEPLYQLAESITPNKTATEWTISVRKGVLLHDGKPFGARDVLFSFERLVKNKFSGSSVLGPINIGASKVLDQHTVRLKFDQPFSLLIEALQDWYYLFMVPEGYDPKRPIGTGPFKLVSFDPGRQSIMARHDEYWDHPKPYLDKVITIDIADETAQVNALQSGQVNAINYLTAGSLGTLSSSSAAKLVISEHTGGFIPFTMRVDRAPFTDVRVRTALKLVIDRPAMLKSVFAGHGQIANDVFGRYDKNYDPNLLPQRHQDIGQAKSLLKAAGHPDLSLQLITTPVGGGEVQASEVFAAQASAAGIKVTVINQQPTDYFAHSYLKAPFAMDYWTPSPYLVLVPQATLSTAPYNETHFSDAHYDGLYTQAARTLDPTLQRDIVHEMMKIDYDQGGLIVPSFYPVFDAVAQNVHGVLPTVGAQPLRNLRFQEFWIE